MRLKSTAGAVVSVLIVGSTAMLAAPGQGTPQPGQATQGRVLIQNRGKGEAVPIDLREVNLETPLRVQVVNGEPLLGAPKPLAVATVRPLWEYKAVSYRPEQEVMLGAVLNGEGAAGWETTGIMIVKPEGTTLILKRQR